MLLISGIKKVLQFIIGVVKKMSNKIIYNGEEYNGTIVNDTGVGEFTSIDKKKNPTGANNEIFNSYFNNTASGDYSHAEGYNTTASGHYSHAEGQGTTAGNTAHAEGNSTTASGQYSHAEGSYTEATGLRSHAEGESTHATNTNSHAEGQGTTASGIRSHAEGYDTLASNDSAHAEGYETEATGGEGSHAEGKGTHATAGGAHAEGINTTASGIGSHAEGNNTTAYGNYSHTSGTNTYAGHHNSTAIGLGTKTTIAEQVALGRYNVEDQTSVIVVGNGTTVTIYKYVDPDSGEDKEANYYSPTTEYVVDDVVILTTKAYKCIQNATGKNPRTQSAYWTLLNTTVTQEERILGANIATLDWDGVLNVIGTNADIQINGTSVTASSGDIANPNISDAYDNTATYAVGNYCIYNNSLYKCDTAVTVAEDFDSTKWTATTVGAELLAIIDKIGLLETALGGLSFSTTQPQSGSEDPDTIYFLT